MIFCIDCKYHRKVKVGFLEWEHCCDVLENRSPVDGEEIYSRCAFMRDGKCGTFAKLFKPKEEGKK